MKKIFADKKQDPAFLYFCQNYLDEKNQNEVQFNINEFAKKHNLADDGFTLEDIASNGHITLMDFSKTYGALFIAFNKSLIVVNNSQLGQLTLKGTLPDDFNTIMHVSLLFLWLTTAKKPNYLRQD